LIDTVSVEKNKRLPLTVKSLTWHKREREREREREKEIAASTFRIDRKTDISL